MTSDTPRKNPPTIKNQAPIPGIVFSMKLPMVKVRKNPINVTMHIDLAFLESIDLKGPSLILFSVSLSPLPLLQMKMRGKE